MADKYDGRVKQLALTDSALDRYRKLQLAMQRSLNK